MTMGSVEIEVDERKSHAFLRQFWRSLCGLQQKVVFYPWSFP
jgi:hypothetical protein